MKKLDPPTVVGLSEERLSIKEAGALSPLPAEGVAG